MSNVFITFRGRSIGPAEVASVRQLIAQQPGLSRRKLSVEVCRAWNWMQPNGRPRDMVCRSLLLVLHRAGWIELPAKRCAPPNNAIAHRRVREVPPVDVSPIEGSLGSLGGLDIRLVRRAEGEDLFAYLLKHYHYLGYSRPVGEHLKYLVFARERPVACLSWSSAPRQLNLRDQFMGAPRERYQHNLHRIAYNTRYLIVPWVRAPHLASHLLARVARRISADWRELYHHPIHLLESFVDTERFCGTCYRAANWIWLGRSLGWGTKSRHDGPRTSIKELWALPLDKNFRQQLQRFHD